MIKEDLYIKYPEKMTLYCTCDPLCKKLLAVLDDDVTVLGVHLANTAHLAGHLEYTQYIKSSQST